MGPYHLKERWESQTKLNFGSLINLFGRLIQCYQIHACAINTSVGCPEVLDSRLRKHPRRDMHERRQVFYRQPIGFDDCPKSLLTLPSRPPGFVSVIQPETHPEVGVQKRSLLCQVLGLVFNIGRGTMESSLRILQYLGPIM